jgi:hypothetical protein
MNDVTNNTTAVATCPPWCHERHENSTDDTHYGPALDVAGRTTTAEYPYMLFIQREIGDETEITLMATGSQRINESRDRAFTVDQARQLYAALGELLATVDQADEPGESPVESA